MKLSIEKIMTKSDIQKSIKLNLFSFWAFLTTFLIITVFNIFTGFSTLDIFLSVITFILTSQFLQNIEKYDELNEDDTKTLEDNKKYLSEIKVFVDNIEKSGRKINDYDYQMVRTYLAWHIRENTPDYHLRTC